MQPEEFIMLCVYILAGVLGLCVGSFLNVVIYRVPNGMNLAKPASHCTRCGYTLRPYDNIPVLSYLFLRGRCRKCGERISPRYMIVEIVNALLWLLSVHLFWKENIVYAALCAVVLSTFICIFFIDLEHMLIFDRFVLILAAAGIVAIFFDTHTVWYDHLIGAVAAGGVFLLIYYLAIWVLDKEGLGFGDVKLAAVTGLLLGWMKMLFAMLIASVVASVVLLILKRVRDDENGKEYPFGPFIAGGAAIALLIGDPIIEWYLSLLAF
ncbi:MAG: prepilin peptidase [Clostridia bacterium]|nr:prepilin peptidase [Clostridia bacterium]